jgi:phosphoadenosine phosphosulfate reductase
MRKVTMVKKLLQNGEPCAKCAQAEELLRARGLWGQIDEVIWAKEGDPESEGAQLARKHEIDLAPFYLIEEPGQAARVVSSTLKLAKELGASGGVAVEARVGEELPPVPLPSAAEVADLAKSLEGKSPAEILRYGLERYGKSCSLAFSGAEDVVLIDMAVRSGLGFDVFCLDTGRLHEETYRFIDRVRSYYGVDIRLMAPQAEPLQTLVRKKGLFSFMQDGHGECCGIRKVEPLRRALEGSYAWATGQRRDQSPSTRGSVAVIEIDGTFSGRQGPLLKLNPLAFWTSGQVWEYIRGERVPYNELHDHGFVSIGCQPCTRPIRPGEHERAARWWWEEATQRECGLHIKKSA